MNYVATMRYNIICKSCGQTKPHRAHGLCDSCYGAQYYAKYRSTHADEIKRYRVTNRNKLANMETRRRRARGEKPASENKQCPAFLGVHVAERVLSKVFKDVKRMPPNNRGYFLMFSFRQPRRFESVAHVVDSRTHSQPS